MLAQVKPWCCPCHGESNWEASTPYTEEKTEDRQAHTQAQRTHTLQHAVIVRIRSAQLGRHSHTQSVKTSMQAC